MTIYLLLTGETLLLIGLLYWVVRQHRALRRNTIWMPPVLMPRTTPVRLRTRLGRALLGIGTNLGAMKWKP